jgi:hypothetical protein
MSPNKHLMTLLSDLRRRRLEMLRVLNNKPSYQHMDAYRQLRVQH